MMFISCLRLALQIVPVVTLEFEYKSNSLNLIKIKFPQFGLFIPHFLCPLVGFVPIIWIGSFLCSYTQLLHFYFHIQKIQNVVFPPFNTLNIRILSKIIIIETKFEVAICNVTFDSWLISGQY